MQKISVTEADVNRVVEKLNRGRTGKDRWSRARLLNSFNVKTDAHLRETEALLFPTHGSGAARRVNAREASRSANIAAL